MLQKIIVFLVLSFVFGGFVSGQNIEKERKYNLNTQLIAPSVLLLSGVTIQLSVGYLGRNNLQTLIRQGNPNFKTSVDDYLQYLPVAQLYGANLMGIKGENSVFNQTKYLLISELTTMVITQILKKSLNVQRPNGDPYSFPSGHTSQTFSGASVLFMEYRETSPLLAYSGLAVASSVGALRVLNNRHWVSDVLSGAGIAMGVTALVYYFKPLEHWNPFGKGVENISFISTESGGGVSIIF